MALAIKNSYEIKGLKTAVESIQKIGRNIPEAVIEELIKGVSDVRNTAIRGIQTTPRQGRFYISKKTNRKQYPGKLGYPPATDSGVLVSKIVMDVREEAIELGSIQTDPPYPEDLETRLINGRPWHPWLKPAIDAESQRIESRVLNAITKAIG